MRQGKFTLFYYSQVQLAVMAMVLSAASHIVLSGWLHWQSSLLVGLSTFLTYSVDNLFDWQKDRLHYQAEQQPIERYHKLSYLLIAISIVGILILILQSQASLKVALLTLATLVVFATARFSTYRSLNRKKAETVRHFITNRLFITTMWSLVCVFLTLWYGHTQVDLRAWHIFGYLWLLIFPFAVLWKMEKSEESLRLALRASALPLVMQAFCLSAAVLVLIDFLVGLFPAQTLVHLFGPAISFLLLRWINQGSKITRMHISLYLAVMFAASFLSALVHIKF